MSADFFSSFIIAAIAAAILAPIVLFLGAMLFEGIRRGAWGTIRRATRRAFISQPLELPLRRQSSSTGGGGGLRFRRVSAAPHVHE